MAHHIRDILGVYGYLKDSAKNSREFRRLVAGKNSEPPVLVYQMQKVGSTSYYISLTRGRKRFIKHCHSIERDNRSNQTRKFADRFIFSESDQNIDIITSVREPISRNISDFIMNVPVYIQGFNYFNVDYPELYATFLNNYPHDLAEKWFDNHIKKHFGIDVLSADFDREKGFQVYENGRFRVLLIRLELPDQVKQSAVAEFLNYPEFTLERHNETESHRRNEVYRTFKENIVLPKSYIDKICDSDFMKRFYNPDFIETVRQYWYNRIDR